MTHIIKHAASVLVVVALCGHAFAITPDKADPLYQSKGDQKRAYKFPPTGQMLPYRTYVPTTWSPDKHLPVVLVLHGGGLNENAPFERTPAPMKDELQKLAEEFNYIIVSPLGYSMSGGFGAPAPSGLAGPGGLGGPVGTAAPRPAGTPPLPPPDQKTSEYSVQDVMNVLDLVEKEYNVDTTKEFITGNSMGAMGTTYLAAKYPEKWLAMAPSEGGYNPAPYREAKFGLKGALFIHKQDPSAPQVETSTAEMINMLASQGVDARTIAVPNTIHENVWFFALPVTFHFFDKFASGK